MKLEYVEIYEDLIKKSKSRLQSLLMLKLKAMNKCQAQFDAHVGDKCYDKITLVKYDLKCTNINDVDEGEIEDYGEISSVDMDEISEESSEMPSGSDSDEIKKFKNDQKIRKESKIMLRKLKTLLSDNSENVAETSLKIESLLVSPL